MSTMDQYVISKIQTTAETLRLLQEQISDLQSKLQYVIDEVDILAKIINETN